MARRKGKSQRRIKDWEQRFSAKEGFEHDGPTRQKLTRRAVKLPVRELSAGAEELDDLLRVEGMVIGLFPGGAEVRLGADQLLCAIAGTFRAPAGASALAVGDVVTVALTRPEHVDGQRETDMHRADGVVLERGPRKTVLARPQPTSGKRKDLYQTPMAEKVIAANMECLVIVASTLRPPLRHGLIDRFLIIAERGQLQPLLVINKIDLAEPDGKVVADFKALGVEILPCSAVSKEGLEELLGRLAGRRNILAGASGVGKSTLINAMVPGAQATTRPIRDKDQRGRHTTSGVIIYDLPTGGIIVDTPGLRELGVGLDVAELPWYFPDFEAPAGQCRFRNCTHTHEPGCGVVAAVQAGQIIQRRYRSYLNILQTLGEKTG